MIKVDKIIVEYAEVNKMCGYDSVMGADCVIDGVEDSGGLIVDESSVVAYQVKL